VFVNDHSKGEFREFNSTKTTNNNQSVNKEYLYYNIMNKSGVLDSYYVLDVEQQKVLTLLKSDFQHGETLNIHFAGYSISIKL
jgi:hypothetical protein